MYISSQWKGKADELASSGSVYTKRDPPLTRFASPMLHYVAGGTGRVSMHAMGIDAGDHSIRLRANEVPRDYDVHGVPRGRQVRMRRRAASVPYAGRPAAPSPKRFDLQRGTPLAFLKIGSGLVGRRDFEVVPPALLLGEMLLGHEYTHTVVVRNKSTQGQRFVVRLLSVGVGKVEVVEQPHGLIPPGLAQVRSQRGTHHPRRRPADPPSPPTQAITVQVGASEVGAVQATLTVVSSEEVVDTVQVAGVVVRLHAHDGRARSPDTIDTGSVASTISAPIAGPSSSRKGTPVLGGY